MTTEQSISLGRQTAFFSFLLGTAIFVGYFLTSLFQLLVLGFAFIVLIGLINLGVLIFILVKARSDNDNSIKLLKTGGLMLLNIPALLFYCWMVVILLNTMRITFTNATQKTLTNINIEGCSGGYIDELEVGDSKTVWVSITGDCSITIDYLTNGQQKQERVASYVTKSMGQKIKYAIGGQNKLQF